MKQPTQPFGYKDQQELINWLEKDLEYQRAKLISEGTKREDIKDEDLTLHIGSKEFETSIGSTTRTARFNQKTFYGVFNFNVILEALGCIEHDDKRICPYIVNFKGVHIAGDKGSIIGFFDIKFNGDVDFSYSSFDRETYFDYSLFTKKATFLYSVFESKVNFKDTCFNQDTCFTGSTFEDKVVFSDTKLNTILTFDNIKFGKDKGSIFFRNINYGNKDCIKNSNIEITNTIINGRIDFNNVNISKFSFKNSNVINGGVVSRVNFEPYIENTDTARIFKHEELARSDTIKALEYKAIEKDRYYKDLKTRIIKKFKNNDKMKEVENVKKDNIIEDNDNKVIENIKTDKDKKEEKSIRELISEFISIWLSRLSNNHGQDWFKAVRFTMITAFVFLLLAYSSLFCLKGFYIVLVLCLLVLFLYIYGVSKYKEYPYGTNMLIILASLVIYNLLLTYFPVEIDSSTFNKNNSFITLYFSYLTPTNLDLMKCIAGTSDTCKVNFTGLNPLRLFSFYFFYILGKIAIGYGIFQVIQAFRKFNIK